MTKYKTTVIDGQKYALVPVEALLEMIEVVEYDGYMNAAGVDNWEGGEFAADLAREDGYYDRWYEMADDELEANYLEESKDV